ncbi:urease accessory protein UreD [Labrenzia sp. 011]|uniref:urease accessory protein UreD n=1 Tax=Labrenzia sp. 011 TaxID=2171494 RepID=UPI000D513CD7|nr:urease accessory protein UreD [Labrenzia sp. 011]PVB62041.1 urease accessory protein [Labrenzia sp. 011]
MYDAGVASVSHGNTIAMQRVNGCARVGFAVSGDRTRLTDLYQSGAAKVRLPKVYDLKTTAVLINTAGGLTGGDRLSYEIDVAKGAHAIVTSQTAERAYQSISGAAEVSGRFSVAEDAVLEWLPQETILFNRSGLSRTMRADLAPGARLLMLESVVLGRKAMGEQVDSVFFRDSWRIRRDGRLVFADDVRLDGNAAQVLAGPATGSDGRAVATLVDCTPDAQDRLALARACLETLPAGTVRAAASAWNGLLTARFVCDDSRDLRNALIAFLTGYRAAELPRVWHC